MLVSTIELRRYMGGIEPEDGMTEAMADILLRTQHNLETYLNRPVEPVQIREYAMTDGKGCLRLRITPVRKIISCGVNTGSLELGFGGFGTGIFGEDIFVSNAPLPPMVPDASVASSDIRLIDNTSVSLLNYTIVPGGLSTTYANQNLLVEYIAGLDGIQHADIKGVIIQAAAREWGKNHVGAVGLRDGIITDVDLGDNRTIGFTKDEKLAVQRYRRRLVL